MKKKFVLAVFIVLGVIVLGAGFFCGNSSQEKPVEMVATPSPAPQPVPEPPPPTPIVVPEKEPVEKAPEKPPVAPKAQKTKKKKAESGQGKKLDDKTWNKILKEYYAVCRTAKAAAGNDPNKMAAAVRTCSGSFLPLLKRHGIEAAEWGRYSHTHPEAVAKMSRAWQ